VVEKNKVIYFLLIFIVQSFVSLAYSAENWVTNENRTYRISECELSYVSLYSGAAKTPKAECMSGGEYYDGDAINENNIVYPGTWNERGSGLFGLSPKFVKNKIYKSNSKHKSKNQKSVVANKNDSMQNFEGRWQYSLVDGNGQPYLQPVFIEIRIKNNKPHVTKWENVEKPDYKRPIISTVFVNDILEFTLSNKFNKHAPSDYSRIIVKQKTPNILNVLRKSSHNRIGFYKLVNRFAKGDENLNTRTNNRKSFSDLWEQYGGNIIDSYEEGYSANSIKTNSKNHSKNEEAYPIDYKYIKTKIIDTGSCGGFAEKQDQPWQVSLCIAKHFLVAKGDYESALIWYLKTRSYKPNWQTKQINAIKSKIGNYRFSKIKNDYQSGRINIKDIRLWAYQDGQYLNNELNTNSSQNKKTLVAKNPTIRLNHDDNISIFKSSVVISGYIENKTKLGRLFIDGEEVELDSNSFSKRIYVPIGENEIKIVLNDKNNQQVTKSILVKRSKPQSYLSNKKLIPPLKGFNKSKNSVALIIGIDKYELISKAPWAESDALTFYDYAQNALGISSDRIKLITGAESSESGIWKAVERWLPIEVDKGISNIYVYFAGHGLASEDGNNAYLIPYDGDPDMLERTAILRSELIEGLKDLNAKNVTMFMDTCYSGKTKGGVGTLLADSRGLRIVKKDRLYNLPSNFTLFSAAGNDETASSHPTMNHGLFSYWMMRGLGGEADSNQDNKITNGELHAFIDKNVQKSAISIGRKQHPQLIGDKGKVIASW